MFLVGRIGLFIAILVGVAAIDTQASLLLLSSWVAWKFTQSLSSNAIWVNVLLIFLFAVLLPFALPIWFGMVVIKQFWKQRHRIQNLLTYDYFLTTALIFLLIFPPIGLVMFFGWVAWKLTMPFVSSASWTNVTLMILFILFFPFTFPAWIIIKLIQRIRVGKNVLSSVSTEGLPHTHEYSKLTQSSRSLEDVMELSPQEFEYFVADLFCEKGFSVETTPLSGDGGVDISANREGKHAIVQCKRYQGTVGEPVIRDLYGTMMHQNAQIAYLVTTGRVSRRAYDFANGKPIRIVDGELLSNILNSKKATHSVFEI